MKLYLSLLVAFSALNSVLAEDNVCTKDAALVTQHKGEKYTEQIATQVQTDQIRVLHPGDAATMDFRPLRLNVHVCDNEVIQSANCG